MGLISVGEAEMSGQTVEVAQEEEVKMGEKRCKQEKLETTRTNKNPLTAEKGGSLTQRVK